jgi:hypothetical protein
MICATPPEEVSQVYKVGSTLDISCTFDVSQLVVATKFNQFRNANMFYELFLEDYDGSLIDIPAVISNIQGDSG